MRTTRRWPGATTSAADAFGLPEGMKDQPAAAASPRTPTREELEREMYRQIKAGFSVPQFCYGVGIGRSLAYELMKEGAIRYVKIGSRRIIIDKPADFLERLAKGGGG